MAYMLLVALVIAVVWGVRVLHVSNKRTDEQYPLLAPTATHGPWATHGRGCKCNVCR